MTTFPGKGVPDDVPDRLHDARLIKSDCSSSDRMMTGGITGGWADGGGCTMTGG